MSIRTPDEPVDQTVRVARPWYPNIGAGATPAETAREMPRGGNPPSTRGILPPMKSRLISVILFCVVAAGAAAQQVEYRLDDGGQWVRSAEPTPGTDEALMAEVRRLLAEGDGAKARALISPWLEQHKRRDNPWLPHAYLLRGDAQTLMGYEFRALYDYEAIITQFPASEEFVRANERELEIAVRYVNGYKRRWMGFRVLDASSLGAELLVRIAERLPGSTLAERALIEYADYYYRERNMDHAAEAYDLFLKLYPRSQFRKHAMERLVFAEVGRFAGPAYDASGLAEADRLIVEFSRRYPADAQRAGLTDALRARLDESAAAKLLHQARWYLRRGDDVAARFMLRKTLRKHPATVAAQRAIDLLEANGWLTKDDLLPPTDEASNELDEESTQP